MNISLLYLLNRLLCSPLEILYTLLTFILLKENEVTAFQTSLLVTSKPLVSLGAFYINTLLVTKRLNTRLYLMGAIILGCLPCFLFPFFSNSWFYILAFVLFSLTNRVVFPQWIDLLKRHLQPTHMSFLISRGTSLYYAVQIIFPFALSFLMDGHPGIWKLVFFSLALLQASSSLIILFSKKLSFPKHANEPQVRDFKMDRKGLWKLLCTRQDFTHYLALFFLGGAGIVMIQAILPFYFENTLHLSYKQITLAFSLCKALAFIGSSPLWAAWVSRKSIYRLNGYMNICTTLFIFLLFEASYFKSGLYIAYLFYGMMQAGSEISWHLSGPIFSQHTPSIPYSNMNLAVVGLRGCICPLLGQCIFSHLGAPAVLLLAGCISLLSIFYAYYLDQRNFITEWSLR